MEQSLRDKGKITFFDHILLRNVVNSSNTAALISFCHDVIEIFALTHSLVPKYFASSFLLLQSS